MTGLPVHDFGLIAEHGDSYEFHIDPAPEGFCRLVEVIQTERGPRRSEQVAVAGAVWKSIDQRVMRVLAQDMADAERPGKKAPRLKAGLNRITPLIGRELALLLWALEEEGGATHKEAILHSWRELAREERWWLYAKAAAPGQRKGAGWRRALFHALAEITDSRFQYQAEESEKTPDAICRTTQAEYPSVPSEPAKAEQRQAQAEAPEPPAQQEPLAEPQAATGQTIHDQESPAPDSKSDPRKPSPKGGRKRKSQARDKQIPLF